MTRPDPEQVKAALERTYYIEDSKDGVKWRKCTNNTVRTFADCEEAIKRFRRTMPDKMFRIIQVTKRVVEDSAAPPALPTWSR